MLLPQRQYIGKAEKQNQVISDYPPDRVTVSIPFKEVVDSSRSYLRAVTGAHPHFRISCSFPQGSTPKLHVGVTPALCSPCQVMRWFWTVVSSLTQEELARLLQFTTGSSQLPPGGFAALCPSFQIIATPTHSTLPTAHTWWVSDCLVRAVTGDYLSSPCQCFWWCELITSLPLAFQFQPAVPPYV